MNYCTAAQEARYYDSATGRFVSEDPIRFSSGGDFYEYVFNRAVRASDATGLSPQDVQRIQAACHKCTQQLVDLGMRQAGTGVPSGWLNDLKSWGGRKQSCKSQATLTQPCLENPPAPYDANWNFQVSPFWGFLHTVVVGRSSDPNDPLVVCDPWRNFTWNVFQPTYP